MSSIMRRRRGLISAIGGSCLWIGLRQPQSCQTGDLPHDDPPYLPRKRVSSTLFQTDSNLSYGLRITGKQAPVPSCNLNFELLDHSSQMGALLHFVLCPQVGESLPHRMA